MLLKRAATDVRIVDIPDTPLACLSHTGPHERVGDTIRRFIAWRKENRLPPSSAATWNVLYDDPDETPPDEHRMDMCCTCQNVAPNAHGVVAGMLEGGRYAVLRHIGADAQLPDSVRYLYGPWLSESGETPRDAPLVLQRVVFFPDVPEHEAVTDIYLPLAGVYSQ